VVFVLVRVIQPHRGHTALELHGALLLLLSMGRDSAAACSAPQWGVCLCLRARRVGCRRVQEAHVLGALGKGAE
jgi:hypothetical protein